MKLNFPRYMQCEQVVHVLREAHRCGADVAVLGSVLRSGEIERSIIDRRWSNADIPSLIDRHRGFRKELFTSGWSLHIEDEETAIWFKMKYL